MKTLYKVFYKEWSDGTLEEHISYFNVIAKTSYEAAVKAERFFKGEIEIQDVAFICEIDLG